MSGIKGSRTERNLMQAFAGESQARNRYTYFASIAKKEGLEQMAAIFEETANQEKEHAERFWKFLEGGDVQVCANFPAGFHSALTSTSGESSATLANLKAAAEGELEEWSTLYPEFAEVAKKEGFPTIAATFERICISERFHERRYRKLYSNLMEGKVFKRDGKVTWKCRNCGYLHEGTTAPEICPACQHPKSYFEVLNEPW